MKLSTVPRATSNLESPEDRDWPASPDQQRGDEIGASRALQATADERSRREVNDDLRSQATIREETSAEHAKFEVQYLIAAFGETRILHQVSANIAAGRVTAVIGPSGCGKSTFLRCLNRMHEVVPSAWATGAVKLDGEDIYGPHVDPVLLRRRVGMVFQKPNPFPSMSIRDNVLSGLKLTGRLKKSDGGAIVEDALKRVALWDEVKDRLGEPGGGLSGGQQQRLCIARALAVEPRVILMDEPASALDPVASRHIEDLIEELSGEYTIVIVTHNMQQAQRVAQDTAFFFLGHLVEFRPTEHLFQDPQHEKTRDYVLGRMG